MGRRKRTKSNGRKRPIRPRDENGMPILRFVDVVQPFVEDAKACRSKIIKEEIGSVRL